MDFFLIPLLTGFAFNWASAFTHFYSTRLGERAGKFVSFVLRNILGIPVWVYGFILAFRKPASPLFIPGPATDALGSLLIVAGTIPIIWGLLMLRLRSFRPAEKDTLVTRGIYNHIRHPIYAGVLLDFIGGMLLKPTSPALLACILGWGYIFVQARLEEIDLVVRIPGYRQYMQQVPRFFPRLRK
jgi:protein-S-isoprenylcysteine O-methyltransferase Ste14